METFNLLTRATPLEFDLDQCRCSIGWLNIHRDLRGAARMLKQSVIALVVLNGLSAAAWAEEPGNAMRGRAYAQGICKSCHAVEAGETASPNPAAKPFNQMTLTHPSGEAFASWINTEHPPIPNSLLKPSQANDILAYVSSLGSTSAR